MSAIKLMVAIPCYQGMCHSLCMKQILKLQLLLKENNISLEMFTLETESLISRARNVCAGAFLKSDCTHLMFIDSDIVFDPNDVLKLINHNKGIIVGLYPMKTINFDKLKETIPNSPNLAQSLRASGKRVGNIKEKVENTSLALMYEAPTGFMLIKRGLLELIVEKAPHISYNNDIGGYAHHSIDGNFYNFFL